MTDERFFELRRLYRETGELTEELFDELRRVAVRFVRFGGLPRSYAPYGVWNDEAADEVLAGWLERRLIGLGHLRSILDQAASIASFRRLAERSLRQYLLNERERTQSQNLYWRLKQMLEEDANFVLALDSGRAQDRWWTLRESPGSNYGGDERILLANAWALGDFNLIHYGLGAKKLSPVLDSVELKRFVVGLLDRLGEALSLGLISRVLSARFGLDDVQLETLDDAELAEDDVGIAPVLVDEAVRAVLSELSSRQAEVLLGSAEDETMEAMSGRLRCSEGTIVNEQRRIATTVQRFSDGEDERNQILRKVVDLLYKRQEEDL